jgi:hypothetical protein
MTSGWPFNVTATLGDGWRPRGRPRTYCDGRQPFSPWGAGEPECGWDARPFRLALLQKRGEVFKFLSNDLKTGGMPFRISVQNPSERNGTA